MQKKLYLLLSFLFVGFCALAQQGALRGTVTDKKNNEPIPFANLVVELNGSQIAQAQSDFDGNYSIKPITPGKYTLKAVILGYAPVQINGIVVTADKITFADVKMSSSAVELKEFEKVEYVVPLISKDQTQSGGTITREQIAAAPTREINALAATSAGVSQQDDGKSVNVRGSRDDATYYYVDGIKVRGNSRSPSIAKSGIEQITVITGGVPAQYGDATGGVISITTKGPSKLTYGGLDLESSQFTDKFGWNLVGFNISGPLYSRTENGVKSPVIGYQVSGEFNVSKDPSPSAIGAYKLNDNVLNDLKNNPLQPSSGGVPIYRASYVKASDLTHVDARQNVNNMEYRINGKLDFKPTSNTNVTVGGNYEYSKNRIYSLARSIFDSQNNGEQINSNYRVFGRFTQRFGSKAGEEKSASKISNAFYSLQVDYQRFNTVSQDATSKDNLFGYGYLGKFKTYQTRVKSRSFGTSGSDTIVLGAYRDSAFRYLGFEGNNRDAAQYTLKAYEIADAANTPIQSNFDLVQNRGLRNGDSPPSIYGMYNNVGANYNLYSKNDNAMFRITAQGSADVKSHAVSFGLEFEQRVDRGYDINPNGLWSIMRQYTNAHIQTLDTTYTLTYDPTNNLYIKDYNKRYIAEDQKTFDKNLRRSLGMDINNTNFIDIDNLSPSQFNLSMFSPDELLQNGSGVVNPKGNNVYYGYDYTGKILASNSWSLEDFFKPNGSRTVGAFQPNYIAGFIQDKFAFKDLVFNIGLRVDRYDANQKVLKDKYLLYEAHHAGDADVQRFYADNKISQPNGIGNDYTVYVDQQSSVDGKPGKIVGYRSGDIFYDAQGVRLNNADVLLENSPVVQPWLLNQNAKVDAINNGINIGAFKDYVPQVNVMPRVSFSFPISDVALFFAHYDVLTQRPNAGVARLKPTDYLFWDQIAVDGTFNNPDLKPEKTVDYELGFKQKLTKSSAITISAFYREMRDMIQQQQVRFAFPIAYQTYTNRDFGTVKGLSISYDLRRTGNVSMTLGYTLQFADGTGSNATSGANIPTNEPDIRTPSALSFDQRHQIVSTLDYRYGEAEAYNGPILFGKRIFENAGANFIFRLSSGTPYTKYLYPINTPEGDARLASIEGGINSARLPWQMKIDMKIDKNINLHFGKGADGNRRQAFVNVYVQVQNLLDARNVLSVYRYSGSPTDDGYLNTSLGVQQTNRQVDPVSYADLYRVRLLNPGNFSLPRRIRVGLSFNF